MVMVLAPSGSVTPSAVLKLRREDIRAVLRRFGVVSAGVFGSVARGEDQAGSDLDLIVQFGPGRRKDLIGLTDELVELLCIEVDVVDQHAVWVRAQETCTGTTILRETVPL
jgi:predicted nucleotidyltransferase